MAEEKKRCPIYVGMVQFSEGHIEKLGYGMCQCDDRIVTCEAKTEQQIKDCPSYKAWQEKLGLK